MGKIVTINFKIIQSPT